MSRFPVRDVSARTPGPSVHAAGDGLTGAYSATVHAVPSGGTCKVIIPALNLLRWYTALCSTAFTASVGDRVLVTFDADKQPWVTSLPTVAKVNGTTVPLTGAAWIVPTLINSWVNGGGGYETAAYLKDPMGFVHLKGLIGGGATNSVAFVLPVGYRPGASTFQGGSNGNGAASSTTIASNGNVTLQYASVGNIGLSGINFLAEN